MTKTRYDWTTHENINRPLNKILRALKEDKQYIFFDRFSIYIVIKSHVIYDHESYEPYEQKAQIFSFVCTHDSKERFTIIEKSTAEMPIEYIESHDGFKHNQHSRRYKAILKQGFVSGHVNITLPVNDTFSSNYMCFAGEYNKNKIKQINQLRKKNQKWLFNIQLQERLQTYKHNKRISNPIVTQ